MLLNLESLDKDFRLSKQYQLRKIDDIENILLNLNKKRLSNYENLGKNLEKVEILGKKTIKLRKFRELRKNLEKSKEKETKN